MSAPLWLDKIIKAQESQSKVLDIGKCGLSELPDELFSNPEFCKQIEILIIGDSIIQPNDFSNPSDNTWHSNSIRIIDERITLFENLREISFLGNAIEDGAEIQKLTVFKKLEILDIGGNKLSIIPSLNSLTALHTLRISNNQLTTVSGINALTKLSFLYLGWNHLETIPTEVNELTALQFLFLGSNKINRIDNIQALKNLKRSYLDY
jgi:Leucine-rich repeat (LRR) protein